MMSLWYHFFVRCNAQRSAPRRCGWAQTRGDAKPATAHEYWLGSVPVAHSLLSCCSSSKP